jgi:MFS family permease
MRQIGILSFGYAALFNFYGGIGLLVQTRVGEVDPHNKALALALVAGAGAVCVTFANPIGGALSDRTTSRLGRRAPWLLTGSIAGGLSALFVTGAGSIVTIALSACAALATINLYHAAIAAIVPDEIPLAHRGRASAAIGVASIFGWALGTRVAATWSRGLVGVGLIAAGVVVAAGLLTVFGTSRSAYERKVSDGNVKAVRQDRLGVFSDRDFTYVFIGRALMVFSYDLVVVYLLYIVEGYIHRPEHMPAALAVATVATVGGCTALLAAGVAATVADRSGRYRLPAIVAGCVGGLALLIPLVSQTWGAFLLFSAVQGAAIGMFYAVDTALATMILPDPNTVARDLGLLNIAATGPPVVAPLAAALVVELAGYAGLFPVAAVGAICAAVSLVGVRRIR